MFYYPSVKDDSQVANKLLEMAALHPKKIRVDNGPEFTSLEFNQWCGAQKIELLHIQPGRPMQNGYIERFNRTFRQDVLNMHLFSEIDQVRDITEK